MNLLPDITNLIKPIPGDDPGGISLMYEGTHEQMLEARRSENSGLPRGDWDRPLKEASWSDVIAIGTHTLTEKSKDLRVAAILGEGLIQQYGFNGFNVSLGLITALIDNFWDELHPRINDKDDIEARMLILEWYADKVATALLQQNITSPTSDAEVYSYLDYLKVAKLSREDKKRHLGESDRIKEQLKARNKPSIIGFDDSVTNTSTEWLSETFQLLEKASNLFSKLDDVISQKMAEFSPSFSPLKDNLSQVHQRLNILYADRIKSEAELLEQDSDDNEEDNSPPEIDQTSNRPVVQNELEKKPTGRSTIITGEINSRDEAYELLEKITRYLMESDPNSPTPYLLRRAVSFKKMTFADMITMFVDDEWQRTNILKLMGADSTGASKNDVK